MKTILKILALLISTGIGSAHAFLLFQATLTTSQEPTISGPTNGLTGQPRATPSGTASFFLNDAQTALSFTATVFNIDFGGQTADPNDNLMAAHIHGGPLNPATGTRAVVWGFFGSPFNDLNSPTAGLASDCEAFTAPGLVGGTCAGTWDFNEGNPNGGSVTLISQLPFLLTDQNYINFHTAQNPGGEIRGQIVRVPEPGAIPLLFGALAGLYFARRQTKKAQPAG
jgi:hypothetical protein